jgi:hypothetical protein
MRIADHIAANKEVIVDQRHAESEEWVAWGDALRESLATDMVRVDAQNVQQYLDYLPETHLRRKVTTGDGFMCPWERCWMEFQLQGVANADVPIDVGVAIGQIDLRDDADARERALFRRTGNLVPWEDEVAFELQGSLFCQPTNRRYPMGPIVNFAIALDAQGAVLDRALDEKTGEMVTAAIIAKGIRSEDAEMDDATAAFLGWFTIDVVLFSHAFANCRNVERIEVKPSRQVMRRMERDEEPVRSHYVLVIDENTSRKVYGEKSGLSRDQRRHIVRGHFAHYTEEKPLFGKHVGRFWVPQFMKGKAKFGEVEKSYQLGAA